MAPAGPWICCQIGSREHYAVPRALHRRGLLDVLLTDAWVDPGGVLGTVGGPRIRERFHEELRDAKVWTPGLSTLLFEGTLRLSGGPAWEAIIERNTWFQDRASEQLAVLVQARPHSGVVFAYSYAAKRVFTVARAHGWTTVLGQIDPGPCEDRLVAGLHRRHAELAPEWQPAPPEYWDNWREEWQLADRVIVNSEWSRVGLLEAGVPESIIRTVPLAYEAPATAKRRDDAAGFDSKRPLRVLFLGQINLRKGIAEVLEAIDLLDGEPVHFVMAGPIQIKLTKKMRDHSRVSWLGAVPHAQVADLFTAADVFLFPTHSDGFGLTQLEALGHGVPVIVSRHCAPIVTDGVNGLLLAEVSGRAIAASIRELLRDPGRLRAITRNARLDHSYGLPTIGRHFEAVLE